MTPRLLVLILSLILPLILLTACVGQTAREERPTPLLLISIDGFRFDYFDLADTPALDRLTAGGVKADSLHHVFPTKTFPTHYSLVTGLHPGSHGIVGNNMWDPDRDSRFSLGNREAVSDGYWYDAGEPIWVTAERQGLTAATFFWPGSEARINRVRPTYWKPYNGDTPHAERIDQVLDWLDLPEPERPDLVTLYFHTVDSAGHRDGPRADSVAAALTDIDRELGRLFDQLDQRGLLANMNILLVSDHGMARVDFDRYILLDEYLDLSRVLVSDWGPAAQIWATDMSADEIVATLDGAHPNLRVWAREDIPARYHFGSHRRVPDVLAEADPEWMISNKPYMAGRSRFSLMGMHGWDPAFGQMHGAFVAYGRDFPTPGRIPAVRSVDVYSLMARLLDLEPAPNDGSLHAFGPLLDGLDRVDYRRVGLDCSNGPAGAELRIGPAHAALHWGPYVHILEYDPESAAQRFSAVDLEVVLGPERAEVTVDGERWPDCRIVNPTGPDQSDSVNAQSIVDISNRDELAFNDNTSPVFAVFNPIPAVPMP